MDFNLVIESCGEKNDQIQKIIKKSFELGFECVAVNTIIDSKNLSGKNINIPEPKSITFDGDASRNFRILTRLTAIVEDNIHCHHLLKSPVVKKYDIIAIQPIGEKMLHHVSSLDIDIICLNLAEDLGYTLKRTYIGLAIEKGICFEISYAPCLRDQVYKRQTISNSQLLIDVTKAKNVIISSGAMKPLELRSVEDVANLGLILGFKMNQSVAAVRKNGNLALSHSGTRRNTGCGFVSISGMFRLPKQQGWIVKACKVPPISDSKKASETTQKRSLSHIADDSDEKSKRKKIA